MKALILAGGFATRLRPLSCARPKTLFPIVNKPLLQWIFERLSASGVDEAILAVNALTQFYIRQQKPSKCGLRVHFSIDPPKMPLGTAGPIKKAEKLIGHNEPFIALNGDIFADINYKQLIQAHKKTDALATIALCTVKDPSRFGVAECEGNVIKRFIEKPPKGTAPSNLINAGAYVLDPEVFSYIPADRAVSIEREVFPKLAAEGRLGSYCVNGLWMDIGKPHEYLETNMVILDAIVGLLHKQQTADDYVLSEPSALDIGVTVNEKSTIGPYAIIGKNVKIGKNVQIANSVVFTDAEIDDNTILDGVIVGEGTHIGKNVRLGKGCIIGDQAKIRDNIQLDDNSTVCPGKEIAEKF